MSRWDFYFFNPYYVRPSENMSCQVSQSSRLSRLSVSWSLESLLTLTRSSCPALRRQEAEKSQRSQSHSVDPVHSLSFNQVSLLLFYCYTSSFLFYRPFFSVIFLNIVASPGQESLTALLACRLLAGARQQLPADTLWCSCMCCSTFRTSPLQELAIKEKSFRPTSVNKNVVSSHFICWLNEVWPWKCWCAEMPAFKKKETFLRFWNIPLTKYVSIYKYMMVFVTPPGASATL